MTQGVIGVEIGGRVALIRIAEEDLFQEVTYKLRPELLERTRIFKK